MRPAVWPVPSPKEAAGWPLLHTLVIDDSTGNMSGADTAPLTMAALWVLVTRLPSLRRLVVIKLANGSDVLCPILLCAWPNVRVRLVPASHA